MRFELVPLPWADSPTKFTTDYGSVRATLSQLILRYRYLQFAISGLFGDWAAVAAVLARKQNRDYAIHTDTVAEKVLLEITKQNYLQRAKAMVLAPFLKIY